MTDRYKVELTWRAQKELNKLDAPGRAPIVAALHLLRDNPRPPTAKTLTGNADYLRIRVGDYRVVYTLESGRLLVLVLAVGHRSVVYRNLP